MRIYLDSCVLIRAIERSDAISSSLRNILYAGGRKTSIKLVTSTITYSEILVRPLERLREDPTDRDAVKLISIYASLLDGRIFAGASFFDDGPTVGIIEVNLDVAQKAADIRAQRKSLKLPDALHIGSALENGCDAILSDDDQLLKAAAQVGLRTFSFEIGRLDALLAEVSAA